MSELGKNIFDESDKDERDSEVYGLADQMIFVREIESMYNISEEDSGDVPVYVKPFSSCKSNDSEDKTDENSIETEIPTQEQQFYNNEDSSDITESEITEENDNSNEISTEEYDLETLVKKGNDDPFHMKAEDYESDHDLEALIKTGSDDPFHMKAEDYESDHDLEALIKTGSDDPFHMKAEDYESDHDLEALIKTGSDDPFHMKAEDYESDHALEALVKSGNDDPAHSNADDYEVDPQLAALIRNGSENSPLAKISELPEEDNEYNGE